MREEEERRAAQQQGEEAHPNLRQMVSDFPHDGESGACRESGRVEAADAAQEGPATFLFPLSRSSTVGMP